MHVSVTEFSSLKETGPTAIQWRFSTPDPFFLFYVPISFCSSHTVNSKKNHYFFQTIWAEIFPSSI